jgi:3-oxoacyl-[acyl-carrier protein] reductase
MALTEVCANRIAAGTGTRRAGRPDDIADVVHWLASPGAGYVNDTVIEADGGRRRRD